MTRIRQRLGREEGFTLIELLVVIVIIGILLAIAVPSYLGFKDRANQRAASADVRAAVPSAEAFYADNGSYQKAGVDMSVADLQGYDQGADIDDVVISDGGATFCLHKNVGGKDSAVKRGQTSVGGGKVQEGKTCATI
jgi:prepilin-type N-terminal cleavage/methylation domain-containing protein